MEVLATPAPPRPQRSLSYNDLKRRRLQRSASNKMTIQTGRNSTQTKRRHLTEQKSLVSNLPRDQKVIEGVIDELINVLGDIRRKKSEKCFFSLKESMTDRPSVNKSKKQQSSQRKDQPLWSNVEDSGQTKQFIRLLLNKNKSQRRMMKFNEVRDKFKEEKQKSLSKDKLIRAKLIQSPFKDKTISKQKPAPKSIEKDFNKQTIKNGKKEEKESTLDHSLEQLTNCPQYLKEKIWLQQIKAKENQQRINIMDVTEISQIRKNDEPEQPNQPNPFFPEKTRIEGSFLKLLDKPIQLENKALNRQVRRRTELERIRRIFPLGFFAS